MIKIKVYLKKQI